MPQIIFGELHCHTFIKCVSMGSEVHLYAESAVTPQTTTHLAGLVPFNITSVCNQDFVLY